MKNIFVVTHGNLSKSLIETCELITGPIGNIDYLSLNKEDNIESFHFEFLKKMTQFCEEEVIVLVDMIGGSPCNIASLELKKKKNFYLISGVNLPMLIELVLTRDQFTMDELLNNMENIAKKSIKNLNSELLD